MSGIDIPVPFRQTPSSVDGFTIDKSKQNPRHKLGRPGGERRHLLLLTHWGWMWMGGGGTRRTGGESGRGARSSGSADTSPKDEELEEERGK